MYDVITADPAWKYRDKQTNGKRGAEFKYPCMYLEAIARLPVVRAAAHDCALHLWATHPFLGDALYVMKRWGFRHVTTSFVWVKILKDEDPENDDPATKMGQGHYTRTESEFALLGVRGSPHVDKNDVRQVINAPLSKHSSKPDEFKRRVERLHGDCRRLELFARRERPGWDCWGYDTGVDIGEALHALPGQRVMW